MNQIADDLRRNHAAMNRDVSVYSVAAAEIERLRSQHRHCDHCGGTWLDDGINAGCYCRVVKKLRAALSKARGHEIMPCGHNSRWLIYGNPAEVDSPRHCLFCEVEGLRAENAEYQRWHDGEGSESPETLLAKSRADCVKLRAALDLSEEYNQQKDGEIERLQAIVDRLPKTADGVPIAPGDRLYDGVGHLISSHVTVTGYQVRSDGTLSVLYFGRGFDAACCGSYYHDPDKALAAREEREVREEVVG